MHPLLSAVLLIYPALSQAAPPVSPSAGTILQQIQPPSAPVTQPPSTSTPKLNVQGATDVAESGPGNTPFMVKRIEIVGNTVFDTVTLQALVAPVEGTNLTVAELNLQVSKITDYYREQGYLLTRAIVPAQSIRDGVVRVQVIEATYGNVILNNTSKISDPLLQSALSSLQSDNIINGNSLDSALLKLSDIPGVLVDAVLTPGEGAVGTANLLVETKPGPVLLADMAIDNYGNYYTGRARIGGTINFINPLNHGDVLSVNALSSGKGMNYGRLGYESLINGYASRLGASYSALRYVLGDSLTPLNAHGTAGVASFWVKHPLLRSQDHNIYSSLQYDKLILRDHIDATSIKTDRQASTLTASLSGDVRDRFAGVTIWSACGTAGRIDFNNANAQLADSATARTEGNFTRLNINLSRIQRLSLRDNIHLSYVGQWADSNLDASQKITAGGVYTVRAYNMGAVSGDSGYVGTVEWRHDLNLSAAGLVSSQFVAFVDHGHLTVNKTPWVAGTNGVSLSGIGAGLNLSGSNQWRARMYVTGRIGGTPQLLANTASARAWIEITKSFSQ